MNDTQMYGTRAPSRILLATVLGFFATTLSLPARALDFTPDSSRLLSDLSYLPLQDQSASTSDYSHSRTTANVRDSLGAARNSPTTVSNSLMQAFSHGITDDFTLRISETYARSNTTNDFTAGAATKTRAFGLDDPVLGMTWRMLDQNTHAVNWDLLASYAPNLVYAVEASPALAGTVARGGSVTTMGTAVSYKTKDFTVYVDGNVTYMGTRNLINDMNSTTISYQPNRQYSLDLNTQTRFNEAIALNLGVSGLFRRSVNGINETSLITFNNKLGNVATFNTAVLYSITPNKLVASLAYSHSIYTQSGVTYPTVPSSNTTTKNQKTNAMGVRLQYLFD